MITVEFHPAAEEEFLAAARYYEEQAQGLGFDFISAVEATSNHVCEFPDSGRAFGHRLRRFLVRRFPYTLIYRAEPDRMLIVAVAHVRRSPGYWRNRA